MNERGRACVGLLLTAPASTVSLLLSTALGGILGSLVWGFSKVWQAAVPALWQKKVEGIELKFPPVDREAMADGVWLGIIMSIVIIVTWLIFGSRLEYGEIRDFVEPFGLLNPLLYLGAFLYWVTLNSLLEEYLFRWFIFEKSEVLVNTRLALVISAIAFTSHHFFGVMQMFPLFAVVLASAGVFASGFVWSLLYLKHTSIWPCYVSHVIVDVTMFGIGTYILFV